MQASRLTIRSNLGYNVNDNHGDGGWVGYSAYTPYIEVHWQRRWKEPGQFTVLLPYSDDVFKKAALVTLENRDEVGIVSKREISIKQDGTYITLSGYFAEASLKWGRHFMETTIKSTTYFSECVAKFVAETLTSKSSANRDNFNPILSHEGLGTFVEDGKIQPTGGSVTYYPITMYTEVGPLWTCGWDFGLSGNIEYDTKQDPCDFIYSILPDGFSLRTYAFTKADYMMEQGHSYLDYQLMPNSFRWFTRQDLADINLSSTPALALGFKFLKSGNHSLTFSKDNGNIAQLSFVIDESDCSSRSAASLDSSVAWWSSSKPVDRGLMFKDDSGSGYKYRAEKDYRDTTNSPGAKSSDYGGSWSLGKMYPVCSVDAQVTKEIKSDNATSILSEMSTQAKLEMLNHWREESVEVVPAQVEGCEYLTNYDIGEKITMQVMQGISYQTYITEVDEVHAKNHVELTFRTGTPRRVKK